MKNKKARAHIGGNWKTYVVAPEDSRKWKCNWIDCGGGMGLAGHGYCSFRGEWNNKKCPCFVPEKELADCKNAKEFKQIMNKWRKKNGQP